MVHSVEDYLMNKIGLEKLEHSDRPQKAMRYFNDIMTGKVQTSPYELMIMFNLLYDLIKYDKDAMITSYMLQKQTMIYDFFRKNFQRFNYFEFKPLIAKLRGEKTDKDMTDTAQKMSGEKIEKVNSVASTMLLDNNPTFVQRIRMEANNELNRIDKNAVDMLGETIKNRFKEEDLQILRKLEESEVPYIQKQYNQQGIQQLEEYFTKKLKCRITDIFQKLDMSVIEGEKFLVALKRGIKK